MWRYLKRLCQSKAKRARRLHHVVEDMLKALYEATTPLEGSSAALQHIDLKGYRLEEVFREMERIGFVDKELRLTDKGRAEALSLIRKHRLYETYLSEKTGYPADEWHRRAHDKEHELEEDDWHRISRQLGNPLYDPHGDPIPTALTLDLSHGQTKPLERHHLETNRWYKVVHVEDDDLKLYAQLVALGLARGSIFELRQYNGLFAKVYYHGRELWLEEQLFLLMDLVEASEEEILHFATREIRPLTSLKLGEEALVHHISPALLGSARRRLMDLGFVGGSRVSIDIRSPFGNPTAYIIRGAVIALRADQAQHIMIRKGGTV